MAGRRVVLALELGQVAANLDCLEANWGFLVASWGYLVANPVDQGAIRGDREANQDDLDQGADFRLLVESPQI